MLLFNLCRLFIFLDFSFFLCIKLRHLSLIFCAHTSQALIVGGSAKSFLLGKLSRRVIIFLRSYLFGLWLCVCLRHLRYLRNLNLVYVCKRLKLLVILLKEKIERTSGSFLLLGIICYFFILSRFYLFFGIKGRHISAEVLHHLTQAFIIRCSSCPFFLG